MALPRPLFAAAAVSALILIAPQSVLASSGGRDTTFGGGDGLATFAVRDFDQGYAIAMQGSKIIVAGQSAFSGDDSEMIVARFESDGDPDLTFAGGDGWFGDDLGSDFNELLEDVAVLPDGRILAVGYLNDSVGDASPLIVRLTPNGELDPTFANGAGYEVMDFGGEGSAAYEVLPLANGKFMVTGGFYPDGDTCNTVLWRFKANGKADHTFSGDGMAQVTTSAACDEGWRMLLMPDGDILVGGWGGVGKSNNTDTMLARFRSNGKLESTFGLDGRIKFNPSTGDFEGVAGLARSGSLTYVAVLGAEGNGASNGDIVLLRVKDNGRPDRTFGSGDGQVQIDLGGNEDVQDMVMQPDGKLVFAGTRDGTLFVARVNASGVLDGGFGTGGFNTAAAPSEGQSMLLGPGGTIVVAGFTTDYDLAVARFLP